MPEWTDAQKKAITSSAREIVCSAAAGSGKTAVMVERVIRFLREGAEPEQFLVMTFTNAAASEMKEKIRTRLHQERNNPLIQNALDKIDLMQISTIHSFCQQLVKNYFPVIDIDPNFQICDTSQRQTLFHEAFRQACDDLQMEENPLYDVLRSRYDLKQAENLISRMDSFLLSLPEPHTWLETHIDSIPREYDPGHPWFDTIFMMSEDILAYAEILLNRMYQMFAESFMLESYRETWKADSKMFHVKQTEIRQRSKSQTPVTFEKIKTTRGLTVQESDWKGRYQKIRDDFKKTLKQVDELLMTDPAQSLTEWQNMKETLQALQITLIRTEERFRRMKLARALADFQDLEQYALQILKDPRSREDARATWRYIFVDECQDISAAQNAILDELRDEENHLFMVGDVKQSIYRFRLADPLIFMDRIQKIQNGEMKNAECIYLQSNFRSRPEILESTNRVFRANMRAKVAEIEYTPEEELIPGRKTEGHEPVQIIQIDKNNLDLKDLEACAQFLKDEIETLHQTMYAEKNRNYQYRDCVILMPAVQNEGAELEKILQKLDIPVFYDGGENYFARKEIVQMRSLLEWIDAPLQDLPLISVLSQPPFCFTAEELSRIRLKQPEKDAHFYEAFQRCMEDTTPLAEKCRQVQKKLNDWQELAETMRVSELIWKLYEETGLYFIIAAEQAGDVKQANLRMLAQQAEQAESRGLMTLRDFLSYMKDQQTFGEQQAATLLGEQDDLVRIMTIHKSKGLQFPVVFCLGMDKAPSRSDRSDLCMHSRLGICCHYKDPEHRISRPTMATEIFQWKKRREEMAEKLRLLYVAMTRAQEKLYMITVQDINPLWSMPEGDGRVLAAKSYTDWWMPVFQTETAKKISTGCSQSTTPYESRVFTCNQQQTVEKEKDFHSLGEWLKSVIYAPVVDELWKKEQAEDLSSTLQKRSVTSLIRNAQRELEEDLEEETPESKRTPNALERRLSRSEMPEAPAFLRQQGVISAAWRGTVTHRILSLMDLEAMRAGRDPAQVLRDLKENMLREHMASKKELDQVREDQIIFFWQSPIGQRILRADEVRREWNFNLLIQRDQEMILQGVIDCAFREGMEWVVLDYKTDRGKSEMQLAEEYRPQLEWYARALEQLTGNKVKQKAIYALALQKWIEIL